MNLVARIFFSFVVFVLMLSGRASAAELRLTFGHTRAPSGMTCEQALEPALHSLVKGTLNPSELQALSEHTGFDVTFLRELYVHRRVLKEIRDGYNKDVKAIAA